MPKVYNHMQDWIYAKKDLSGNAKLLLQRMVSLSSNGKKQVFIAREAFASQLGMSVRTISDCFKVLVQKGYIEEAVNPNPFNRTRNFNITKKTTSEIEPADNHENEVLENSDLANSATSSDTKSVNTIDTNSATSDSANSATSIYQKIATSSLDRNIDVNVGRKESETLCTRQTIFTFFGKAKSELVSEYPEVINLNLKSVCDKYFLYRRNGNFAELNSEKDLMTDIQKWMINEIEHYKKVTPSKAVKNDIQWQTKSKQININDLCDKLLEEPNEIVELEIEEENNFSVAEKLPLISNDH